MFYNNLRHPERLRVSSLRAPDARGLRRLTSHAPSRALRVVRKSLRVAAAQGPWVLPQPSLAMKGLNLRVLCYFFVLLLRGAVR